jgi:hypothetical protein
LPFALFIDVFLMIAVCYSWAPEIDTGSPARQIWI